MSDEPADEADDVWCATQRREVLAYLANEGFQSPSVGEWPAWHVAPLISVWAVESVKHPGWCGWWVVSGDFPMDYTTCNNERHPRQALRDIGLRWREAASNWANGEATSGWSLSDPSRQKELAPLLAVRAALFLDIAADDANWAE